LTKNTLVGNGIQASTAATRIGAATAKWGNCIVSKPQLNMSIRWRYFLDSLQKKIRDLGIPLCQPKLNQVCPFQPRPISVELLDLNRDRFRLWTVTEIGLANRLNRTRLRSVQALQLANAPISTKKEIICTMLMSLNFFMHFGVLKITNTKGVHEMDAKQTGFRKPHRDADRERKQEDLKKCLEEFEKRFPTEADCIKELEQQLAKHLKCRRCHLNNAPSGEGKRSWFCRSCKTENWLTSGTFFEKVHEFRAWRAAIWILDHGCTISASHFHLLFKISDSTAVNIFHKIRTVIRTQPDCPYFESSSSGFIELMGKRSRETPARCHPNAEELSFAPEHDETYDRQNGEEHTEPGEQSDGNWREQQTTDNAGTATEDSCEPTEGFREAGIDEVAERRKNSPHNSTPLISLDGNEGSGPDKPSNPEDLVYSMMSEQETAFDELQRLTELPSGELISMLSMLEIEGKVISVSGWRYKRTKQENNRDRRNREGSGMPLQKQGGGSHALPFVDDFAAYIKDTFHRVSRKYMQNYLAQFWCKIDREYWQNGSVFDACLRADSISDAEILNYVSPRMLKIWIPAEAEAAA
ncbi:MAG TPA: hypothetical protein V6C72_14665, partial [Chroococcales cyanobacterium]